MRKFAPFENFPLYSIATLKVKRKKMELTNKAMASLLEGKSRGLCLVRLCAKYRLLSATLSPYH